MGARGPAPKRSEERTRRNATGEDGIETKKGDALPVRWPAAGKEWGKPVKDFYNSLKKSGQHMYYQQSDIQFAWLACDELNEYRTSSRRSAMHLQSVLGMLGSGLLLTEGERRRAHVELEVPQPEQEDEVARKRRELQEEMGG